MLREKELEPLPRPVFGDNGATGWAAACALRLGQARSIRLAFARCRLLCTQPKWENN
jgi:hypothetical protein